MQKPFRNHNSPVPGRERDLSALMEEKKKQKSWGHTYWERFQSSGGECDHKKVCEQRMRPLRNRPDS